MIEISEEIRDLFTVTRAKAGGGTDRMFPWDEAALVAVLDLISKRCCLQPAGHVRHPLDKREDE